MIWTSFITCDRNFALSAEVHLRHFGALAATNAMRMQAWFGLKKTIRFVWRRCLYKTTISYSFASTFSWIAEVPPPTSKFSLLQDNSTEQESENKYRLYYIFIFYYEWYLPYHGSRIVDEWHAIATMAFLVVNHAEFGLSSPALILCSILNCMYHPIYFDG